MADSINQHWDTLKTCIVGKSYPEEMFSFVKQNDARYVLERIADETEEDLQNFISLLENYNVDVIRPTLPEELHIGNKIFPPPLTPRDDIAVIGKKVFMPSTDRNSKWNDLRGENWPTLPPVDVKEFTSLNEFIKQELFGVYGIKKFEDLYYRDFSSYKNIEQHFTEQGNTIHYNRKIDSAMVSRIGKDLFFGTWNSYENRLEEYQSLFPDYRCHVINTEGHLDGVFCPVAPGLIISSGALSNEELLKHFPDWEIVSCSEKQYSDNFIKLKSHTKGKWWVPGEETNKEFTNFVNYVLEDWVGFCEETVIGVNLLMLDKNNIVCPLEDDKVFKAFSKYGIEPHVVPFRHYNFWDSGWHCLTNDLNRIGEKGDFFSV